MMAVVAMMAMMPVITLLAIIEALIKSLSHIAKALPLIGKTSIVSLIETLVKTLLLLLLIRTLVKALTEALVESLVEALLVIGIVVVVVVPPTHNVIISYNIYITDNESNEILFFINIK